MSYPIRPLGTYVSAIDGVASQLCDDIDLIKDKISIMRTSPGSDPVALTMRSELESLYNKWRILSKEHIRVIEFGTTTQGLIDSAIRLQNSLIGFCHLIADYQKTAIMGLITNPDLGQSDSYLAQLVATDPAGPWLRGTTLFDYLTYLNQQIPSLTLEAAEFKNTTDYSLTCLNAFLEEFHEDRLIQKHQDLDRGRNGFSTAAANVPAGTAFRAELTHDGPTLTHPDVWALGIGGGLASPANGTLWLVPVEGGGNLIFAKTLNGNIIIPNFSPVGAGGLPLIKRAKRIANYCFELGGNFYSTGQGAPVAPDCNHCATDRILIVGGNYVLAAGVAGEWTVWFVEPTPVAIAAVDVTVGALIDGLELWQVENLMTRFSQPAISGLKIIMNMVDGGRVPLPANFVALYPNGYNTLLTASRDVREWFTHGLNHTINEYRLWYLAISELIIIAKLSLNYT